MMRKTRYSVGASLLAMVVRIFASKLAPTKANPFFAKRYCLSLKAGA
jgi:hypothetical protein